MFLDPDPDSTDWNDAILQKLSKFVLVYYINYNYVELLVFKCSSQ